MASARLNGTRLGRRERAAKAEAKWHAYMEKVLEREAAKAQRKPPAHVAHLTVIQRYLQWLRGPLDHRTEIGCVFGPETT